MILTSNIQYLIKALVHVHAHPSLPTSSGFKHDWTDQVYAWNRASLNEHGNQTTSRHSTSISAFWQLGMVQLELRSYLWNKRCKRTRAFVSGNESFQSPRTTLQYRIHYVHALIYGFYSANLTPMPIPRSHNCPFCNIRRAYPCSTCLRLLLASGQ